MKYGLTPQGFNKKTFQVIKLEIETILYNLFGPINLDDNSVFAQFIGPFAEREALLWYALESIYNSMYPDTANDSSLDNVCQWIGLTRLNSVSTKVTAELTGKNQTFIPINSEVSALGVNTTFKLTKDILVSNDACIKAVIEVGFIGIGEIDYTVIINGEEYTYTTSSLGVSSKGIIISELAHLINLDHGNIIASNTNNTLLLVSNDNTNFNVFISDNLSIVSLTTLGKFIATTKGEIPLPAGLLTIIQTPIGGWISVYNPLAGKPGRDLEGDDEFRERRSQSLKLPGAGTIEAMRANLLNLVGVTAVTVYNNPNDEIDPNGLPPHSFQVLILGGDDTDIGQMIWDTKPAGIPSYGNNLIIAKDSTGKDQAIYFSRPISLYIYVNINITLNDSTIYPANANDLIKNNIILQIKELNVNDDVIYQSLYKSVFSVSGIGTADISIGSTLNELTVPTLSSANINVPLSQIAVTDINKITINIV
jgi:uncharacterized phage protein gp47/JayE